VIAVTVPILGEFFPVAPAALTEPGAVTCTAVMTGDLAVMAAHGAAETALDLRDQALAALDGGDPGAALALARGALGVLAEAELGGGPDAAAVLVALAEIEEALDRYADAAASVCAAISLLGGDAGPGGADGDLLLVWCQAQERQAGLERLAGAYPAATARLTRVLDTASAAFGEASQAVVSAANTLGVVGKYAGEFDAAQAAYHRALAAAEAMGGAGPLTRAGLLHNLGGLAHSRGDAAAGIPLAEEGLALRAGTLGATHPDVARDNNALGALYHLAGRYADAGRAYQRALAVFEDCYGTDHFEVAMTCANLAVLQADQGRFRLAEALGRRALRILETVLEPGDAEVGLTLLNLATPIAGQGRRAEAVTVAARAEAILADRLPAGHPHIQAARDALDHLRSAS
jgi:tetratricopeptide (TPR) repeat protein